MKTVDTLTYIVFLLFFLFLSFENFLFYQKIKKEDFPIYEEKICFVKNKFDTQKFFSNFSNNQWVKISVFLLITILIGLFMLFSPLSPLRISNIRKKENKEGKKFNHFFTKKIKTVKFENFLNSQLNENYQEYQNSLNDQDFLKLSSSEILNCQKMDRLNTSLSNQFYYHINEDKDLLEKKLAEERKKNIEKFDEKYYKEENKKLTDAISNLFENNFQSLNEKKKKSLIKKKKNLEKKINNLTKEFQNQKNNLEENKNKIKKEEGIFNNPGDYKNNYNNIQSFFKEEEKERNIIQIEMIPSLRKECQLLEEEIDDLKLQEMLFNSGYPNEKIVKNFREDVSNEMEKMEFSLWQKNNKALDIIERKTKNFNEKKHYFEYITKTQNHHIAVNSYFHIYKFNNEGNPKKCYRIPSSIEFKNYEKENNEISQMNNIKEKINNKTIKRNIFDSLYGRTYLDENIRKSRNDIEDNIIPAVFSLATYFLFCLSGFFLYGIIINIFKKGGFISIIEDSLEFITLENIHGYKKIIPLLFILFSLVINYLLFFTPFFFKYLLYDDEEEHFYLGKKEDLLILDFDFIENPENGKKIEDFLFNKNNIIEFFKIEDLQYIYYPNSLNYFYDPRNDGYNKFTKKMIKEKKHTFHLSYEKEDLFEQTGKIEDTIAFDKNKNDDIFLFKTNPLWNLKDKENYRDNLKHDFNILNNFQLYNNKNKTYQKAYQEADKNFEKEEKDFIKDYIEKNENLAKMNPRNIIDKKKLVL